MEKNMNNYILKPGQWKGRWRRWIRTFPRLMPETQRLAQMRSLDAWKIWNHKHFMPLLFSFFLVKNLDFEERFYDEFGSLYPVFTIYLYGSLSLYQKQQNECSCFNLLAKYVQTYEGSCVGCHAWRTPSQCTPSTNLLLWQREHTKQLWSTILIQNNK